MARPDRLFGWYRHTAVILNLIAIGAAAWIWASLTRASIPRLLLAAAMLLTFWHMLFWAPTGMQESLHHAGAIAMAGCFAAVLGPVSAMVGRRVRVDRTRCPGVHQTVLAASCFRSGPSRPRAHRPGG